MEDVTKFFSRNFFSVHTTNRFFRKKDGGDFGKRTQRFIPPTGPRPLPEAVAERFLCCRVGPAWSPRTRRNRTDWALSSGRKPRRLPCEKSLDNRPGRIRPDADLPESTSIRPKSTSQNNAAPPTTKKATAPTTSLDSEKGFPSAERQRCLNMKRLVVEKMKRFL